MAQFHIKKDSYEKIRFSVVSLAAICMLFAGCGKDKITYLSKVKVHVNDFSITQDEFPTKSTSDVANYEGVKAITLAFYSGTTEVYKT